MDTVKFKLSDFDIEFNDIELKKCKLLMEDGRLEKILIINYFDHKSAEEDYYFLCVDKGRIQHQGDFLVIPKKKTGA